MEPESCSESLVTAIDQCRFRSNPRFDAVAVNNLSSEQRGSIESIGGGKIWSVLCNRSSGQYTTALDHQSTMLFYSLQRPRSLTGILKQVVQPEQHRDFVRLLFDEILQVELPDGSFTDGVRAYEKYSCTASLPNSLDRLSNSAINHAISIRSKSEVVLARRLYTFNTTPRTQRWNARLGNPDSLTRWLGLTPGSTWLRRLRHHFSEHGSLSGASPWLQWTNRAAEPAARTFHKIYVSPKLDRFAEVLRLAGEVCVDLNVPAFKVGATVSDILRPDRLVIYLHDEPSVWQLGTELQSIFAEYEPHGVPFTAPLGPTGVLSWAVDPGLPATHKPIDEPWSWRVAVSANLACSIARATGKAHDSTIKEYALERLRLDKIEPNNWSITNA